MRIRDVVSWRSDPFYLAFHSRIPWTHLLILNSSELSRLFLSVFLDEESAEDVQHFPCCSMASESVKCGDSCATSNHLLNDHTPRRNSNIAHLQRVDGHLIFFLLACCCHRFDRNFRPSVAAEATWNTASARRIDRRDNWKTPRHYAAWRPPTRAHYSGHRALFNSFHRFYSWLPCIWLLIFDNSLILI